MVTSTIDVVETVRCAGKFQQGNPHNMAFVVYKITQKKTCNYYIGKTSLRRWNTGYMGSGTYIRKAIRKHGRSCFKRKVLGRFKTEQEAYDLEAKLITEKELKDPLCYNIQLGGLGQMYGENLTQKTKNRISQGRFGCKHTESTKAKIMLTRIKNRMAIMSNPVIKL